MSGREVARAFGPYFIGQDIVHIRGADIFHELLRDHGHGRGEVFKISIDARTGQRARRIIALVFGAAHFERREYNRFIVLVRRVGFGFLRVGSRLHQKQGLR